MELFVSTEGVGKFYALTQIAYTPISMVGAMFLSFLVPILFNRAGDATDLIRVRNTQNLILKAAVLGVGLTLVMAVLGHIFHASIFQLFVSAEYREMSVFVPYVVIAAGLLQVSQTIANIVVVENRTKAFLPLAIIGNTLVSIMNLAFTNLWGVEGLISGMLIGAIIHLVWMIQIVRTHVKRTDTALSNVAVV